MGPIDPNLPTGAPSPPAVATSASPGSDDDDPNGDSYDYNDDDSPLCDYSLSFSALDDLNAVAGGLRSDCIAIYALQTLMAMLDTAYDNYTTVNNGYDEEFGYYVTYITKLVPSVLDEQVMFDRADTTDTMELPVLGPAMKCMASSFAPSHYLLSTNAMTFTVFACQTDMKNSLSFPCTDADSNKKEMSEHTTALTLIDIDGYNGALLNAGLSLDWVVSGNHEVDQTFVQPRAGRKFEYQFTGFPVENASMVVPNPKDIITGGLGSIPDLRADMEATLFDMILGSWTGGAISDAAQVYSVPVFMLMQAVDSMAQAKALGQQEQKEEAEEEKRKKDFILLIISVILMVSAQIDGHASLDMCTLSVDQIMSHRLTNSVVRPHCR